MTDKKISELPTITGASLSGSDLIPIVDVSSNATSKVTRAEFFKNITGNVGIGTSTPAEKLDVAGNIKVADGGTIYSNQNLTLSADQDNDNAASVINFNVDGSEVADFNNAGYLRFNKDAFGGAGICNQQESYALNLGGGSNAVNTGLNISLSGSTHAIASAGFLMRDTTAVKYGWSRSLDAHYWLTGGSERLRITSTGNVGIGTSTPGSKLSIVGLPTSSAGLSSGDIWNDGGTLKIV
jgi:hypothetical protein